MSRSTLPEMGVGLFQISRFQLGLCPRRGVPTILFSVAAWGRAVFRGRSGQGQRDRDHRARACSCPDFTSDGTDYNPDSTSAERMDEMDAELPTDWSDDALVDYLIERVSVLCWPCMLFPHTPPLFSGCCVCALRFLTLLLCSLSSRIG
jgi:hypothetical protein